MTSIINWEAITPTAHNCWKIAIVMFGINSAMAIFVLLETMMQAEVGDELDPALVLLTPLSVGLFFLTLAIGQCYNKEEKE